MKDRINLFDFDDVLAHSHAAVMRLAHTRREIPLWQWWHVEELSIEAASITEPIEETFAALEEMPGEHWILTARNGPAVEYWLDLHGRRHHFAKVCSTSHAVTKNIPAAQKKTFTVAYAMHVAREVHFFDDTFANLCAAERVCPGVITHHVSAAFAAPLPREPARLQ